MAKGYGRNHLSKSVVSIYNKTKVTIDSIDKIASTRGLQDTIALRLLKENLRFAERQLAVSVHLLSRLHKGRSRAG